MKKHLSVLALVLSVLLLFAACGQSGGGSSPAANPSTPAESSPAAQPSSAEPSTEPSAAEPAPAPAGDPDLVKVATTPHIAAAAIWAADELGYFAEENITIETTSFVAMAPAIAALASGDIDVSYMGVGVHALAAKGQVKIFTMNNLSYGDFFIANKSMGITDLASLEGKTIAVPKGSTGDMLVNMVLKKNGLDPANYEIVNMDAAGIVAGMTAGQVAAAGIWEPFVTEIGAALGDNMVYLGEGKAYSNDIAFIGSYGASDKMFADRRDVLVRFTRAYLKACDYLAQNPDKLLEITLANTEGTKEAIEAQVAATDLPDAATITKNFSDGTALGYYDSLIAAMVEAGSIEEEPIPSADFVDLTIMQDATK